MDSSPAITLPLELRLRVVIQRESDGEHELYVAQCLDYDLAAQGSTLKELKERFERTLMGQIIVALANDEKPFANLAPAPERYFEVWETASELRHRLSLTIPAERIPINLRRFPSNVPRGEAELRVA